MDKNNQISTDIILDKMDTTLNDEGIAIYKLANIYLNPLVGKKIKIAFSGECYCIACEKKVKKLYSNGYCYPCSIKLPECDLCIVKPERCHYHLGTCRDPKWGEEHCLIPHVVYLSFSSGFKVGITRAHKVISRWIDQGASAGIILMKVGSRLESGLREVEIAKGLSDKTDWRKMLKEDYVLPTADELLSMRNILKNNFKDKGWEFQNDSDCPPQFIRFPNKDVKLDKVTSLSLDKKAIIESTLLGIKGQYLIFHEGVINIRSHTGYKIKFEEFSHE